MTLDTEIWAAIFVPIGLLVIFFIYCGACMARASFLPEIRCDNFDEMVSPIFQNVFGALFGSRSRDLLI